MGIRDGGRPTYDRGTYRTVSYTHLDVYKRQSESILDIQGMTALLTDENQMD